STSFEIRFRVKENDLVETVLPPYRNSVTSYHETLTSELIKYGNCLYR
ncbi:MAG: hypothetical protein ACJAXX_002662, partial [Roseivirga sp.]